MENFALKLLGLGLLVLVWWLVRYAIRAPSAPVRADREPDQEAASRPAAQAELPGERDTSELYAHASKVYSYFEAAAHPTDLLGHEPFKEGVDHLRTGYSNDELIGYVSGSNAVVACMSLEALAARGCSDQGKTALMARFNEIAPWTRYFVLRVLNASTEPEAPIVGTVLSRINYSWQEPFSRQFLHDFVRQRLEGGEKLTFGDSLEKIEEGQAEFIKQLLDELGSRAQSLVQELDQWRGRHVDLEKLKGIGRVWEAADEREAEPIEHETLLQHVARLEAELGKPRPRSFLLNGENGVGKTAIVRALAKRLRESGWTIFEASHADLVAGMSYMGELEERLRELVRELGGNRRVLWIAPRFHALAWAGRHQYEPTSVLDYLLPFISKGEVTVVGETTPGAYQKLLASKPRCRTALETVRVEPLSERATLDLGQRWIRRHSAADGQLVDPATLREAWNLAQQFLGSRAAPGNLLEFLELTLSRLMAAKRDGPVQIQLDDLLLTLSQLTGLPSTILDERASLDLAGLRQLFQQRVMGQGEAVDCLVERVAMIKAGLTDPTRPQGVFLFTGPTGTGKTEIAKTLAEFLFGSQERLVRLDMSEFQDEASLMRIFGDPQEKEATQSLVEQIAKQPFSVVLLDEFEKANPRIWNLFLQVFDDGRLTDRLGRTADFRHALVIMTSNLGSNIETSSGPGFVGSDGSFSVAAVQRAVDREFTKEFLNRIDRIIIFRPLSRETMREILRREVEAVFRRRGLRNRSWAVEWDSSALDFLLEKGFTADLGARPLRRAIERYLLTPLAMTIVNHQFPEGDQFLFVSSHADDLRVEFIDPEAPELDAAIPEVEPEEAVAGDARRLEDIILSARSTPAEVASIRGHYDRIAAQLADEQVTEQKNRALARTAEPGFWDSPERFAVLDEAEYLDRIDSGMRSAGSLLERLENVSLRGNGRLPRDLVSRLAQQLYLLDHACDDIREGRPHEAFLLVEAGPEGGPTAESSDRFAQSLGRMYRGWAERRGMRHTVLDERHGNGAEPYRMVVAFSGYAAFALLEKEEGLHLFEIPEGRKRPARRMAARVRVIPQPLTPEAEGEVLLRQALAELAAKEAVAPSVVRRYREAPSPLVRDNQRGWRTGKLDRVLAGDFDLMH